jgi:hypothetical protein
VRQAVVRLHWADLLETSDVNLGEPMTSQPPNNFYGFDDPRNVHAGADSRVACALCFGALFLESRGDLQDGYFTWFNLRALQHRLRTCLGNIASPGE